MDDYLKTIYTKLCFGRTLFFGLLLLTSALVYGQKPKPIRVLFLGNSVFYYHGGLYAGFEGFCREAGLEYQAVSQRKEPTDPHGVEFLEYGRIPLNLPEVTADNKVHQLIRTGKFDYVIVEGRRSGFLLPQDVSLPKHRGSAIPYEQNLSAISSIHRTIVESGAQTVLYMHPGQSSTASVKNLLAQVYQRLHSDLEKMKVNGKAHKVILVPALWLWVDAVHKYGIEGWYADEGHGNALARYSSACMLYAYLTGKDPRKNSYDELTELSAAWETIDEKTDIVVPKEDAKWVKDQVWLYYQTRPR